MSMEEVYKKLLTMESQFERFSEGQARVEAAVNDILLDVQALVPTEACLQPANRQSAVSRVSSPSTAGSSNAVAARDSKTVSFVAAEAPPEPPETPRDGPSRRAAVPVLRSDRSSNSLRASDGLHDSTLGGSAGLGPNTLPVQPRTFHGLVQTHTFRQTTARHSYRKLSIKSNSFNGVRYLPLHPTSWPRVVFDILSIVALLYESITVPVIIAWDVRLSGALLVVSWAVLVFWILDVMFSFVTGSTEGDDLMTELGPIARKYLRTWFLPDCAVIAVDLIGMLPESLYDGSGTLFLRITRLAKIGRFVRAMAKFKMGLFSRVEFLFMSLFDRMSIAEHVQFGKTSVKLFLFIVWLNHIGCCLWYYIVVNAPSDTGASWRAIMEDEHQISDATPSFVYLIGLYWSISSMFSGASYVPPSNAAEAIFTQVYIIFSALFVSSLTSSLAAVLIRAQMVMQEQNSKMSLLAKYLQQRAIDPYIAMGVRDGMKRYLRAPKRVSDKDVSFLSNLSLAMMKDLKSSMYSNSFVERPVFVILNSISPGVVAEICTIATQVVEFDRTEDLILPDAQVEHAHVVLWGSLHWAQADSHRTLEIDPGRWICEVALFTHWRAMGLVQCLTPSELLSVSADAFGRVLVGHHDLLQFVRCFAAKLTDAIFAGMGGDEEVTDCSNETDADGIVALMPAYCREMLSLPVLQLLQQQQSASLARMFVKAKDLQDLEGEIRRGQCHLTVNTSNLILRVVTVVVLRLVRSDGLLCARLGTFRDDQLSTGLSLPGTKVRDQEDPDEAMQRILAEFASFAESTEVVSKTMDVAQKHSTSYGVDSKYIRRIYHSTVDRACACPSERRPVNADQHSASEPRRLSLHRSNGRVSELTNSRRNSFDQYLETLDGWDLFTVQQGNGKRFEIYAWAPEADFERFNGEDAEFIAGVLSRWLAALTPDIMQDINIGQNQHSLFFC